MPSRSQGAGSGACYTSLRGLSFHLMWGRTVVTRRSSQNGEFQIEQGTLSLNMKWRMFREGILMVASGLHRVYTGECFCGWVCMYTYAHTYTHAQRDRDTEIERQRDHTGPKAGSCYTQTWNGQNSGLRRWWL